MVHVYGKHLCEIISNRASGLGDVVKGYSFLGIVAVLFSRS